MKLFLLLLMLVPGFAQAIVDADGRIVVGRPSSTNMPSMRNVNDPLPAPALTLEEVAHLKAVGSMVVSEQDSNRPYIIRGVRYEFLTAQQIINFKAASAVQYGLKVTLRDPSQSCADRMCAVLIVTGRAKK